MTPVAKVAISGPGPGGGSTELDNLVLLCQHPAREAPVADGGNAQSGAPNLGHVHRIERQPNTLALHYFSIYRDMTPWLTLFAMLLAPRIWPATIGGAGHFRGAVAAKWVDSDDAAS